MDDQIQKDTEREKADDKMIDDAFQHLLDSYLASRHRKKVDIITKAFNFARQAHKGVRRLSGEPYIMHPIAVAQIACKDLHFPKHYLNVIRKYLNISLNICCKVLCQR